MQSRLESGAAPDDMVMFMEMSAESYQKLQYVANQTGASMDRVERICVTARHNVQIANWRV